jgi:hypothetical protein
MQTLGNPHSLSFCGLRDFENHLRPIVNTFVNAERLKTSQQLPVITLGRYKDNTRKKENAITRNVVMLDYDYDVDNKPISQARREQLIKELENFGWRYIILDSARSLPPDNNKFHVLILTKDLSVDEYKRIFKQLDYEIHRTVGLRSDSACSDISRAMYVGVKYVRNE